MKDRTGKTLTFNEIVKKIFNRISAIDLEFEMMVLRYIGFVPIHHFRRFFYRLGGMKIGKGSTIHCGAIFYDSRNITLGEDSIIGENAVLDGRDTLKIGNHVDIASEVMIYNSEHDLKDPHFGPLSASVVIEDYVFIGPRAIILPGVTLHKGSAVAAGAVVTKDVEEGSIVGGVPAKEISKRDTAELHYRLGRARWFR